jgi:adenylosuccinate synthase
VDAKETHIRRDIEYTRAAMTAKIDMIQERLEQTVQETGSTVVRVMNTVLEQVNHMQEIIANITSTVDATVERDQDPANKTLAEGKPGLGLIADMSQRPWVLMGTAVLMGYILGLGSRTSSTIGPATARSASGVSPDRCAADNSTGHPFIAPTGSPAGCLSTPSAAHMTDPDSPP